eukprot:3063168-Prorocentrum_lima.AAC.1
MTSWSPPARLLALLLLLWVSSRSSRADDQDQTGGLGPIVKDDIITVPAATYSCALKVEICQDEALRTTYRDFLE